MDSRRPLWKAPSPGARRPHVPARGGGDAAGDRRPGPVHRRVALDHGHAHGVRRDPVEVVHGPVDRVQHPGQPRRSRAGSRTPRRGSRPAAGTEPSRSRSSRSEARSISVTTSVGLDLVSATPRAVRPPVLDQARGPLRRRARQVQQCGASRHRTHRAHRRRRAPAVASSPRRRPRACRRAGSGSTPPGRPRAAAPARRPRAAADLPARLRRTLGGQVEQRRDEARIGPHRRGPRERDAGGRGPSRPPRRPGRRRPPCGRTRNRSGPRPRRPSGPASPAAGQRARWSLMSGSSQGWDGGPDREQNTRSYGRAGAPSRGHDLRGQRRGADAGRRPAAPGGPEASFIASGTEWVTNSSRACSRAAAGSRSRAACGGLGHRPRRRRGG